MKTIKTFISLAMAVLSAIPTPAAVKELISADKVGLYLTDKYLVVSADFILDSLDLKTNRQVIITPVVNSSDSSDISENFQPTTDSLQLKAYSLQLPSILVNGRNMHISYERGVLRNFPALCDKEIMKELRRYNGTPQTVEYVVKVPVESWMKEKGTALSFRYDPCGCGVASAHEIYKVPIQEPLVPEVLVTNDLFEMPEINVPEVQIHAGKARIQFEVDRTALHVVPYTCRNGQLIDNRAELQVIDDSVKYALSDPNVELVGIDLCGYASPESPYLHNVELADGRVKILADYLADRYNLPRGAVTESSVPENWGEFREFIVASDALTDLQRRQLLELIDAPATTPEEYDHKERLLKTDPRYAKIYKNMILPVWFPKLRATSFVLRTQLKDMDDESLREVYEKTPGKMSLQELCRVARLYPADTEEFNEIVQTALAKYPHEQIAIVNAAIGAMGQGDFDRARNILKDAEQTHEVFKLKGIMAESERNYEEAARFYDLAGDTDKAAQMREKSGHLKKLLDEKD